MKIMILSDSHMMERAELLDLLKENSVDYYIHCGDIFMDYDDLPLNNFYLVRGNNDYGKIPDVITPTFDNLKFFVTHGHRYSVGYNLNNLYQEGKKNGADVICYGHTHRPFLDQINDTIVINPGSVYFPRGQYHNPTYCIFDTTTKQTVFYDVLTKEQCFPEEHLKSWEKELIIEEEILQKSIENTDQKPKKKEPFYKRWFK